MEQHTDASIVINELTFTEFGTMSLDASMEVLSWRNAPEIRQWMYTDHVISEEEHLQFVKYTKTSPNKYWRCDKNGNGLGVVSLINISSDHRRAELGIYKNPGQTEKGAATSMLNGLIDIAFQRFGLHSIRLEVLDKNIAAIEFYKKQGFVPDGRLKDYIYKDGKWQDVIAMGLINEI